MLGVLIDADGHRLAEAWGTMLLPPLGAGESVLAFPELTEPPGDATHRWDAATRQYVARVVSTNAPRMTIMAFRRRLTFTRECVLDTIAHLTGLPVPLVAVQAQIRVATQWLNSAARNGINVADPDTIGLAQLVCGILSNSTVMALVGVPALTTEQAATLQAALLAPVAAGEELSDAV